MVRSTTNGRAQFLTLLFFLLSFLFLFSCPLSPTSSDYASSSSDSDDDYGLFSNPDSISRMLGPRLHHPDRTRMGKHGRHGLAVMGVGVGGVGVGGAGVDAKSAAPPAARRRVVGVEG